MFCVASAGSCPQMLHQLQRLYSDEWGRVVVKAREEAVLVYKHCPSVRWVGTSSRSEFWTQHHELESRQQCRALKHKEYVNRVTSFQQDTAAEIGIKHKGSRTIGAHLQVAPKRLTTKWRNVGSGIVCMWLFKLEQGKQVRAQLPYNIESISWQSVWGQVGTVAMLCVGSPLKVQRFRGF